MPLLRISPILGVERIWRVESLALRKKVVRGVSNSMRGALLSLLTQEP